MELLAPAGNYECFLGAIQAGADAVYLGGSKFSARAYADNFKDEEICKAILYAHVCGKKVYMTVNTLLKDGELSELVPYMKPFYEAGLDGVIVQDFGVFTALKEAFSGLSLHASTQMTLTGSMGTAFLQSLGAERIVPARELSLQEIRKIKEDTGIEIEVFVHGAMCISYSGRCLLSNYFTGRDANKGACTHPCRWKYAVVEETRPGEYMPVYENERGTYIFNSKDLCMIEHIPEMVDAGIDSLKIEGRMKTALYVATVARTYRKAIDDYFTAEELYHSHMDWYKEEISKCTYRQFTTGFYFGKPDENTQIYDNNTYVNEYIYLGMIEEAKPEKGLVRITQRNKFCVGDTIEIMKPSGENVEVKVEEMFDGEGNAVESAPHPQQEIWLRLSVMPDVQDILRVGNRKDAMPE